MLIAFRILPGEREMGGREQERERRRMMGREREREREREMERKREREKERVYLLSLVPEIENSHVF